MGRHATRRTANLVRDAVYVAQDLEGRQMIGAHDVQKMEKAGCQSDPFANYSLNAADFTGEPRPGKALETLKARFAIMGYEVYDGSNDDFIVTRCDMSLHCPDFAALRSFARMLGATK